MRTTGHAESTAAGTTDASAPEDFQERFDFEIGLQSFRDQFQQSGSDQRARAGVLRAVEISFERSFKVGNSIVINLATFDYVSAPTRTAALKAFIARFGTTTSGWAFEVGRPMVVGGGACPG